MMTRTGVLAVAALLSASVVACQKSGEKEQNAEGVANRQAEQSQEQAAREVAAAQAEADQRIAAARADFEKAREDYRHSRQLDIDRLQKTISDLDAEDRTATGKTKVDLDTNLPGIHAQRDAFLNDLKSLEYTTPAGWDASRARIDKEWDSLTTSVSNAR
jgi:hypothetical protein